MNSILIIEDDNTTRLFMEKVLSRAGFAVHVAANGEQGISALQVKKPDLVLCDIMMPGMDGHTVLEILRGDGSIAHVPFVFVTALGGREAQRRGMCGGADDYLAKPFTAEELVNTVVSRLCRLEMIRHQSENNSFRNELATLTQQVTGREREILLLVGQGLTSKEIAARLDIRLNTVEVHRANLMRKLAAPNAAKLARWAFIAEQMSVAVR
jgi:DNA-binding NarL/FixJ family response regulator